jgi:hypothetical protein
MWSVTIDEGICTGKSTAIYQLQHMSCLSCRHSLCMHLSLSLRLCLQLGMCLRLRLSYRMSLRLNLRIWRGQRKIVRRRPRFTPLGSRLHMYMWRRYWLMHM